MKPAVLPPKPSKLRYLLAIVATSALATLALDLGLRAAIGSAEPAVASRDRACPSLPRATAPPPTYPGVAQLAPGRFTIARALVERLAAAPSALTRSARIMPTTRHGEPDGLKLYAIRRSSVLAAAGFENGDTVLAINGHPLADPQGTVDAFRDLASRPTIVVELRRRGEPMTLRYAILP